MFKYKIKLRVVLLSDRKRSKKLKLGGQITDTLAKYYSRMIDIIAKLLYKKNYNFTVY